MSEVETDTKTEIKDRVAQRRAAQKDADYKNRARRSLITPEGIDLKIELASVSARFGALMIDILVITLMLVAASYLIMAGTRSMMDIDGQIGSEIGVSLFILVFFFLRSFYFMFFEMGRHAATPGKRLMKIRVAAKSHPRLTANAVFARNALREIEIFLPLSFIFSIGDNGVDGWMGVLGMLWAGIFMFFPLFNKDNLRAGDLIAGTWVVKAPRPILAADLAKTAERAAQRFAFTPAQIDAYGIKELHVRAKDAETVKDVAFRIKRKIGWVAESGGERDLDFLQAYYKALRGNLETKLLMGVRRADKFDKR
jgi:uncharacterized RDD family membrane protein YckC